MKIIELLAPAGNMQAFHSAIDNGADAIYLGGKSFSARAFAGNFSNEEIKDCVEYAHLRNVKIYVALNTLLNEYELENAIKQAHYYHDINVDALIIQDLGLYYRITREIPDMEIHASTQMHIHNIQGVINAKKLGFKRVVIARESTQEFINEACKEDIEIEIFAHGAICASYSGQCLISSFSKNRSANKGMCAQCCRLKYKLLDKNKKGINTASDYLLSAKDMCLLEDIPSIINAGVSSIKIEGRMKSAAYVGFVTSLYRKAIDSFYEEKEYHLSKDDELRLKVLFNREFTDKYYIGEGNDIYNNSRPNHLGIKIGEIIGFSKKRAVIRLDYPLRQFDGVRLANYSLKTGIDDGFIVNYIYKNGKLVNMANKGEIIELDINSYVPKGSFLYKTLDKELEESIAKTPAKHIPLSLEASIFKNQNVIIIAKGRDFHYQYESEIKPLKATNAPLSDSIIKEKLSKLNDSAYFLSDIKIHTDNDSFLKVSEINAIRRSLIRELDEYRLGLFAREPISLSYETIQMHEDKSKRKLLIDDSYAVTPIINPDSSYREGDNVLVSEIGGLFLNGRKIANYSVNIMNSFAYELLLKLGFSYICLSSEINKESYDALCKSFAKRNGFEIEPFVLTNTKRTLMHLKDNPFSKAMKEKPAYLSDGNLLYEIEFSNNETLIIEPSASVSSFGRPFVLSVHEAA